MTESVGQGHTPLTSPSTPYVFQGPARIAIRTRTNDQPRYVDTRLGVWTWHDGGRAMKVDWSALKLKPELTEMAKGFIAYALERYAPQTALMFADSFRTLSNSALARSFPWTIDDLTISLEELKKSRLAIIGFRRFIAGGTRSRFQWL